MTNLVGEIPAAEVVVGDSLLIAGRLAVVLETGRAGGWRLLGCGYALLYVRPDHPLAVMRRARESEAVSRG